ncbi:helix-turn-helix transcriptional regulator [Solemya elarraichensis gill symbiont]|uniref:DNA-binding protein n=1 Tax=Solemya elarraichensis gill symbiont TaxID=1918949 RepID=A0A1T2L1J3_9GAMM|nr:helix-turn-helix transcriptional regulator [Solemya elarraichensis gill symbiont]OOZ38959.1 hypothetical protein BOW52_07830 [Solemya elarraichensis gill symbiont]
MKQKSTTIRVHDFMERDDGWGNSEGRAVHSQLIAAVGQSPGILVFYVSFDGVRRVDVSFARESVVELAVRYRGRKGFCLKDIPNQDMLENLEAAAIRREQPIGLSEEGRHGMIGLEPSRGNKELLDYVLETGETSASYVADKLELKLTNASTKLKQLLEAGFILRKDEKAPSGGVEFRYFAIR